MKKYILFVLILFFSVQVFAQKESLEERYTIPEGQILKLYKEGENTKVYFFNPIGFDKASLIYFRYLALKDSRIINIKENAGTRVISIQVTNNFEFNSFKNRVLIMKEEIDYLLANYEDHIGEIEKIIYEGGN